MKRTNQFKASNVQNNITWYEYYERLVELAISVFKWKNLPPNVDARFLELTLFNEGKVIFFKDKVLDEYLVMKTTKGNKLDIYNEPINRRAYANNGYQIELTNKDSVIIYNNYMHSNSRTIVENFARRLYNIDRAIDVNTNAQKTPILIRCNEEERLSLENLYMKYDGNQPVIFGEKELSTKPMSSINTGAPYVCDKLYQLRTQIWNEALTYLGIENVNIMKKERLISDEVKRNSGGIMAARETRLIARQQACEKINKMFGLNIEVEYDVRNQQTIDTMEGDESNE